MSYSAQSYLEFEFNIRLCIGIIRLLGRNQIHRLCELIIFLLRGKEIHIKNSEDKDLTDDPDFNYFLSGVDDDGCPLTVVPPMPMSEEEYEEYAQRWMNEKPLGFEIA